MNEIENLVLDSYNQGWKDAQQAIANVFDNYGNADPENREFFTELGNIIRSLETVSDDVPNN
jgi:Fe-S-cluster formation regulator IscX/YfhJ